MSREERAKQFAPFDAMSGLRRALAQKEWEKERCEKRELSEERTAEIEQTLTQLLGGEEVEVTFYHEGTYLLLCGRVSKIDVLHRALCVEEGKIPFRDVYDIKVKN